MQLRYKAVDGQNLFDIVLNTYGAIEYIYKLIKDNNIENLNYKVKSGDVFVYDSDMVTDTTIFTNTTLSGVRFATAWEPLFSISVSSHALLQENGFYLLQENGGNILL